jgi:chromosome partitioning protein
MRITVFNQKGGVGKTTTALNLGAAYSRHGMPPLWIDLDPQGYLTEALGIAQKSGRSVLGAFAEERSLATLARPVPELGEIVPAHAELLKIESSFGRSTDAMSVLAKRVDMWEREHPNRPVILDCSPLAGMLTLAALLTTRSVLIPVSGDYLSLKGALGVDRTVRSLEDALHVAIERRVVITRFDTRRRMAHSVEQALRARFGDQVCITRIAESVSLAESPSRRTDVFRHAPASRGARDYLQLFEELRGALSGRSAASVSLDRTAIDPIEPRPEKHGMGRLSASGLPILDDAARHTGASVPSVLSTLQTE